MGDLRPGDYVRVDEAPQPWFGVVRSVSRSRARVRPAGSASAVSVARGAVTVHDRPTPHPGPAIQAATYGDDRTRSPQPKAQPVRDADYLAWIRTLPCAFCGKAAPSEASHHGRGGMATKAGDDTVLPACRGCHQRHHGRDYSPLPWLDQFSPEARRRILRAAAGDVRERYEREVL